MKDLIEALTILQKYTIRDNPGKPTQCENNILRIIGIGPVSEEDTIRLNQLSFKRDSSPYCSANCLLECCTTWSSHRFGFA